MKMFLKTKYWNRDQGFQRLSRQASMPIKLLRSIYQRNRELIAMNENLIIADIATARKMHDTRWNLR